MRICSYTKGFVDGTPYGVGVRCRSCLGMRGLLEGAGVALRGFVDKLIRCSAAAPSGLMGNFE